MSEVIQHPAARYGALLAAALAGSSVGFKKPIYFISLGYGLSMVLIAPTAAAMFWKRLNAGSLLHLSGLAAYGVRLAAYLFRRGGQDAFQKNKEKIHKSMGTISLGKKLGMWTSVSPLYVLMALPAYYTAQQGEWSTSLAVGLPIMYLGLVVEAMGDEQKSSHKARHPDTYVSTGLYRLCRQPNYLGEVLFWTGNWLSGVSSYHYWHQWVLSLIGWAGIVGIMKGSSARLAKKQQESYGNDPKWVEYANKTPILVPFVGRRGLVQQVEKDKAKPQ